jgi:transcriptional regulator with XRE-family HTH domain
MMADAKYEKAKLIGAVLKIQREKINISQKEIADRLSYRNANFISMIETNKSTVPLTRINDFVEAYEMPKEFGLVLLKYLYPECYQAIFSAMPAMRNLGEGSKDAIDKKVEKLLDKLVSKIAPLVDRKPNRRGPILGAV